MDEEGLQAILSHVLVLEKLGPTLGRPYVDHIKQSKYSNMKELRVQNKNRLFRIFFAFDPGQTGILLIAGDKRGDKKFYKTMIPLADRLYEKHLENWKKK